MRLRDHFFRVCWFPKTFPNVWEVLETSFTKKLPLFFKINRDHRDIFDMRLRDHFFRVFRLPKTFPCARRGCTGCNWTLLPVFKKKVTPSTSLGPMLTKRTFNWTQYYRDRSWDLLCSLVQATATIGSRAIVISTVIYSLSPHFIFAPQRSDWDFSSFEKYFYPPVDWKQKEAAQNVRLLLMWVVVESTHDDNYR